MPKKTRKQKIKAAKRTISTPLKRVRTEPEEHPAEPASKPNLREPEDTALRAFFFKDFRKSILLTVFVFIVELLIKFVPLERVIPQNFKF